LESVLNECGIISDHPQQQTDEAAKKFQKCINEKFQSFAQQTLSRGDREQWSLIAGGHIFLAVLKYVAKFDRVTRQHLGWESVKPRFLSHFAPDIHNELIHLSGSEVHQASISSVQKANKYCIICDMSPNNVHVEHISQIFGFVEIKRACVKIQIAVIVFIHTDVNTCEVMKIEIIIERKKS